MTTIGKASVIISGCDHDRAVCGFLPGYLVALPTDVIHGVDRTSIVAVRENACAALSVLSWCLCYIRTGAGFDI